MEDDTDSSYTLTDSMSSTGGTYTPPPLDAATIASLKDLFDEDREFRKDEAETTEPKDPALRALMRRSEEYANYEFNGVESSPAWQPTNSIHDLAMIALTCSARVRGHQARHTEAYSMSHFNFKLEQPSQPPAQHRVLRAVQFWRIERVPTDQKKPAPKSVDYDPNIVIAISAVRPDIGTWLNVFDRQRTDVSHLIRNYRDGPIEAHTGYVEALDLIFGDIKAHLLKHKSAHVVFTGHAIGAAIASLAYLKAVNTPEFSKDPKKNFRFSLVTFGCPPVLSKPLTSGVHFPNRESGCVALAVMLDYDVSIRLDRGYIHSLVVLARETCQNRHTLVPPAEAHEPSNTGPIPHSIWTFPNPSLFYVGETIFLAAEYNYYPAIYLTIEQISQKIFAMSWTLKVGIEQFDDYIDSVVRHPHL